MEQQDLTSMESNRNLVTTAPQGGRSGSDFNDRTVIQDIANAVITQIILTHHTYINSITVHYRGQSQAIRRGGPDGTVAEVALEDDEFLRTIEGSAYTAGRVISWLSFTSNKGRKWGPYGRHSGTDPFTWSAGNLVSVDLAPRCGLLYFSGSADTTIRQLQATFADCPSLSKHPSAVRYEEQADLDPSSQLSLSKFARSIMSPVVTLAVGDERIEFHTNEDVLCRLPFFRAALKGSFKEASDRQITMPEDEPEIVAALIEFLYVGSYTYTYGPGLATVESKNTPTCDLKEGSFHARVYITASKYDCQLLVEAALRSLMYAMQQLDGIEVVKLLKEMYDRGCNTTVWEANGEMVGFSYKLLKILKRLYVTDGEGMKSIVSECPALANDLLRLSVSS